MKLILLVFIFLSTASVSLGQKLIGKVFELSEDESKIPLAGANIFWAGTQIGTTSDADGRFSLNKLEGDFNNLIISYIGYKPDTLSISSETDSIEIVLSVNRELQEVLITGSSLSKYIDELDPRHTEVITSKELLKAACCNLSESFETNASVDVAYRDAVTGAKQIQLLGLAGIYSQMMYENIPTLRGIATTYGLNYVPGPWMQSIYVSKGAASVVNGYESVTGQINIEYKKPDDPEKFYLNIYENSRFKGDINANASYQFDEKLSTMILGHGELGKREFDSNGDSFSDQPNIKQLNFINRWKYASDGNLRSQIGFQYLKEERSGGQVTYDKSRPPGPGNGYGIDIDTDRFDVFTKVGLVFPENPDLSLGLIVNFSRHDQNALIGLRDYNGRQTSFYSNLLFIIQSNDAVHKLNTGGSFVYDKFEESLSDTEFKRNESAPGLFVEYTYSPSENVVLVPGARVDFHNIFGTLFTPRFHMKLSIDPTTSLRASVGKGFRSVNVIAENLSYLASSRSLNFLEDADLEEAWNYGLNLTKYFTFNRRDLRLSVEFYRTEFINQLVVDVDSDIREVAFYNLKGESYSNSFQIEMDYELFKRLNVLAALRYTDVKSTYGDVLLSKPLINKYKGLLTFSYVSKLRKWLFDLTFQFNGDGRIPGTSENPKQYQRGETFPSYLIINAQVTKRFKNWDLYLGGENLTNYTQDNPIIAADDPWGEYFDASMVWGPLVGVRFYLGIRLSFN